MKYSYLIVGSGLFGATFAFKARQAGNVTGTCPLSPSVKAGIVEKVKDYGYSSWGEYDGSVEPVFQICDTRTVLNRIPFKCLEKWVNEPS